EISRYFDSVSVCLSKGLGAPVGSVLCGSREIIKRARRWRKMVGGGMRQAGIIAAGGLYALEHNRDRLATDHENARLLAQGLKQIDGVEVDYPESQTNMVFITPPVDKASELQSYLAGHDILILGGTRVRLVTHLGISSEDIAVVVEQMRNYFS
ncbi:MAG: beta-eliminating lyase-related protein, partial [Desulfofustis sp.]